MTRLFLRLLPEGEAMNDPSSEENRHRDTLPSQNAPAPEPSPQIKGDEESSAELFPPDLGGGD